MQHWDALAYHQATGPGGNRKTGGWEYGSELGYLDVTVRGGDCVLENDKVATFDLGDSEPESPFQFPCLRNTHKAINGAFSPLNDAHFFGGVAADMYKNWFGLTPLESKVSIRVHYGSDFENAFWDGQAVSLGDGHDRFHPLTTLDIVTHEISHGFHRSLFQSDLFRTVRRDQ